MKSLSTRAIVLGLAAILALTALPWGPAASAAEPPMKIRISAPGPRNLSFLPIDLISRIGADRAEGAEVHVRYVDGGSTSLLDLALRNVDFGAAGLPAMLSQRLHGQKVTVLAAIDDLPLYALMVRKDLQGQVKSVADLQGRVVGVTASSLTVKTTSEQLTEILLTAHGVSLDSIRVLPVGQSWTEQSAVLAAGTVDAVMSFEPVASRLRADNLAYVLVSLADPEVSARIPGAGFLLGALATRPEVIERTPERAEKMVAILRRTLQWMASHSPEEIVDALAVKNARERAALVEALGRYKRLYSPDGRLSSRQLRETEVFFQRGHGGNPAARGLRLEALVDDRWAGRRE